MLIPFDFLARLVLPVSVHDCMERRTTVTSYRQFCQFNTFCGGEQRFDNLLKNRFWVSSATTEGARKLSLGSPKDPEASVAAPSAGFVGPAGPWHP